MTKRRSMSGAGRGVDAFFGDDQKRHTNIATDGQTDTESELRRATFYIQPEQNLELEELKLRLARQGVRTNKSALVRLGLRILIEQEPGEIATRVAAM